MLDFSVILRPTPPLAPGFPDFFTDFGGFAVSASAAAAGSSKSFSSFGRLKVTNKGKKKLYHGFYYSQIDGFRRVQITFVRVGNKKGF